MDKLLFKICAIGIVLYSVVAIISIEVPPVQTIIYHDDLETYDCFIEIVDGVEVEECFRVESN